MKHSSGNTDKVIAALEQSNRIYEVHLSRLADWQLEEVSAAMQVPFPELTDLQLSTYITVKSRRSFPIHF